MEGVQGLIEDKKILGQPIPTSLEEVVELAKKIVEPVPPATEARTCTCGVTKRLKVLSVVDPAYFKGLKKVPAAFDTTNEHYGWRLGDAREAGFDERTDAAPTEVHVCANPEDDESHFNTIAPSPWELIKLDCGYWGSFYRERSAAELNLSREFGMVQGQDVWLCRFHTDAPADAMSKFHAQMDELPPDADGNKSAARRFLELCRAKGAAVQIITHTLAPSSPLAAGLDDQRLTILLPDLHLPEQWPAEPVIEAPGHPGRHPDAGARAALQWRLIAMQHVPGRLFGNPLSTEDQKELQRHIAEVLGNTRSTATFEAEGHVFSAHHFRAELAYVERRIRAGSTWFYKPAKGYAKLRSGAAFLREGIVPALKDLGVQGLNYLGSKADPLKPLTDIVDRLAQPEKTPALPGKHHAPPSPTETAMRLASGDGSGLAKDYVAAAGDALAELAPGPGAPLRDIANTAVGFAAGDHYRAQFSDAPSTPEPSAGVDLWFFLELLKELKGQLGTGQSLRLHQLGDLFELWMGREFLYYDFPSLTMHPIERTGGKIPSLILKGTMAWVADGYQKRSDRGWDNLEEPSAVGVKKFIYDPVPIAELGRLFVTGASLDWNARTLAAVPGVGTRKGPVDDREFRRRIGQTWLRNRKKDNACYPPEYLEEIGTKTIERSRTLLADRIQNVENFYGPLTAEAKRSRAWESLGKLDGFKARESNYRLTSSFQAASGEWGWSAAYRPEPAPGAPPEYFWNRAILDLFLDLQCEWIHGNHDGYRSDPLIRESKYASQEVIGRDGLWLEHVHRFDPFNRDGRSFGAGVTNLVHYFMDETLQLDKAKDHWLVQIKVDSAERKENMTGAAQWFLIAGVADRETAKKLAERGWEDATPFAIFACGHTHTPDLIRVQFQYE